VDLEQGEVPPRSLDHDCLPRRQVGSGFPTWALPYTEQGAQPRHVQPGPGPVDDAVERSLHHRTGGEDQVAAVLDLIDRVGVAEAAAVLLVQVEPEAQARTVDPAVDDLAQPPYRPGLGQGVCDLSQALGFIDPGEAVALLGEVDAGRLRGGRDVLGAVEDDLRPERRMPAHLDRHVPEGRVHDVERVVVDELPGLVQVADHSGPGAADLPHGGRRTSYQDQEHAHPDRVIAQVLFGDPVLALLGLAVDHRHLVCLGPGANAAGEPAGQPHQMRVVQLLVALLMPTPPPDPEPARVVPEWVIGVEHDPVNAVIAAGQQLAVPFTEFIDHLRNLRRPATGDQSCPEGATASGRSPGRGVVG